MEHDYLIWQLCDSAFPTGGFAHSSGLEAAWQQGEVGTPGDLYAWLAASLGQLWTMDPDGRGTWRSAWSDPAWQAPFVSLFADVGRVDAMTADGGILEGRFERRSR